MDMGDAGARWSERGEWVQYWAIDPTGKVILQNGVRCGESGTFTFVPETDGIYSVFVDAGTNFFRVAVPGRPASFAALRAHRLVLQELDGRLYFRVPHGRREVSLQIHSRDGAGRIRFIAPDGLRLDREIGRDFHPVAKLSIPVKPEDWGAIWAMEVEKKNAMFPMVFFFEEGQSGLMSTSPEALLQPVALGRK